MRRKKIPLKTKLILIGWSSGVIIVGLSLSLFIYKLQAPHAWTPLEQFVISENTSSQHVVADLVNGGYIKSPLAFSILATLRGMSYKIRPGGYLISQSMNAWQIINVLTEKPPEMVWVQIPEGLRKEEIADIFAKKLGWTHAQEQEWILVDTDTSPDYMEGVYFPGTYLISKDDTPLHVAQQLEATFNQKFAPYAAEAAAHHIAWTHVLTLASIIQREAAGSKDMPLISGILWNRLNDNIKLEVDATVQYARGSTTRGWWAPITPQDIQIHSLFNTYRFAGLPPHPISNPGINAISAVLHPEKTSCLFYIHDSDRTIHCAPTYDGQLANVALYLK